MNRMREGRLTHKEDIRLGALIMDCRAHGHDEQACRSTVAQLDDAHSYEEVVEAVAYIYGIKEW